MVDAAWGSFIVDLFCDTYTMILFILILNSQSVGVAQEVNNKRAQGIITISTIWLFSYPARIA